MVGPKGAAAAIGVEGAGFEWCLRKGRDDVRGEVVGVVTGGGGSGGDYGDGGSGFLEGFGEGLSVIRVGLSEPSGDPRVNDCHVVG